MKRIVLGILVVFISCNGQKKAVSEQMDENKSLTLLLSDGYSGSDTAETLIVRDAKTLQSFFSKINRTRKPGLPVPEIDFSEEMALVLCIGKQADGKLPRLVVLQETDSEMVMGVVRVKNLKNSGSAVTSPFCVYKMPLTEKEILFKE